MRLNLSTEVQASKDEKAEAMQPSVHFIAESWSLHYYMMTKGSGRRFPTPQPYLILNTQTLRSERNYGARSKIEFCGAFKN